MPQGDSFRIHSLTLPELLERLARPGAPGSAVAALAAAALGVSLLELVAERTVHKEETGGDTARQLERFLVRAHSARDRILTLCDQDYRVAAAMIRNPGEKSRAAGRIPLEGVRLCRDLLDLADPLVAEGYAPVLAEAVTGVELLGTAVSGLLLVIEHNLAGEPAGAPAEVRELLAEAPRIRTRVEDLVRSGRSRLTGEKL